MCACVCGSCPLESEVRACPITTNTVALCTQHHTTRCRTEPAECCTWAPLLPLIRRFGSQTCRGRPPAETRSRAESRSLYPPSIRRLGHLIGQMLRLLQLIGHSTVRHVSTLCLLDEINFPPRGGKANLYDRLYFCTSQKTRQSYLLPLC